MAKPNKYILRFFRWYCKPAYHADIEGDLLELFQKRYKAQGARHANRRLLKDVLLLFRPGIINNALPVKNSHTTMLKHYTFVALRTSKSSAAPLPLILQGWPVP